MSSSASIIFLIAVVLAYISIQIFIYNKSGDNENRLALLRSQEKLALADLLITCDDERFAFSGLTAVIVDREEFIDYVGEVLPSVVRGLKTVTYLQNSSGEYFCWKWYGSGRGYIRHIKQEHAKIALRDKYISPSL